MDGRSSGRATGSHRRFEILVVCTANLCRSPMIEALLREELTGTGSTGPTTAGAAAWTVGSAGTQADDGRPVHPLTAQALFEHGVALPDSWRSRHLDADVLARADLVLTASRSHRSEVVRLDPRVAGHTFTLRQFLRLLGDADAAPDATAWRGHPGDQLLEAALAARGLGAPVAPEADDIPDPVGRPYPVFRELADELTDELRVLSDPPGSSLPVLTGARPQPPSRPWWAPRSTA